MVDICIVIPRKVPGMIEFIVVSDMTVRTYVTDRFFIKVNSNVIDWCLTLIRMKRIDLHIIILCVKIFLPYPTYMTVVYDIFIAAAGAMDAAYFAIEHTWYFHTHSVTLTACTYMHVSLSSTNKCNWPILMLLYPFFSVYVLVKFLWIILTLSVIYQISQYFWSVSNEHNFVYWLKQSRID